MSPFNTVRQQERSHVRESEEVEWRVSKQACEGTLRGRQEWDRGRACDWGSEINDWLLSITCTN